MMTVESLKDAGANVEEGLSRCLNKEDFYLKMVNMGLTDQNFQLLGPALKAKDFDRAFELCHSLKGVIGNLSLTPLYDLICQLTEMLRSKTDIDCTGLYSQIMTMQEKLLAL
ncbi:MAG: Hpt domain-containing protein [Spirochaetales bacterium]|nr:Hpt domain-containing protein [Spirochaetales bacterium]